MTHPNWRDITFAAATTAALLVVSALAAGLISAVVLNAAQGLG